MNFTDEQIEEAARILCEMRGKRPDDVQLDAAKSTAAIAWGWLWHVTTADDRLKTARHLLGQMLDKDLKRYGIQTAKAEGAQVNVQEIEAAMLRGEFGDA
jgi:hypothetical protein